VLGGLTAAQLESLGLLVIGAMALVFAQQGGGLRRSATAAANSSV